MEPLNKERENKGKGKNKILKIGRSGVFVKKLQIEIGKIMDFYNVGTLLWQPRDAVDNPSLGFLKTK